jgi:hypothetical protein
MGIIQQDWHVEEMEREAVADHVLKADSVPVDLPGQHQMSVEQIINVVRQITCKIFQIPPITPQQIILQQLELSRNPEQPVNILRILVE